MTADDEHELKAVSRPLVYGSAGILFAIYCAAAGLACTLYFVA